MNIDTIKTKADSLLARYSHTKQQVRDEKQYLADAKQRVIDAEQAQSIVQAVAQEVQTQVHHRIASVVTRCLETVFGSDAYEFAIEFVRKRGKTEAKLTFIREGHELSPTGAAGIGQVDVAALALRLAALMLSHPRKRLLLICDEPMKNVNGAEYQARVGELLLSLAQDFGVQFIIVTDDSWLKIGKIIDLDDDD